MLTFSVGSNVSDSETAAAVIADRTPNVSSQTKLVYQALLIPALENAVERNYSESVSRVVYHCPTEIIAKSLGISRMTLWRHLRVLQDLGLVAKKTHKATCRRTEVRSTGTVWCVKFGLHGSPAKLTYGDVKHRWRPDFHNEVRQGRTSYRALVTYKNPNKGLDINLLRQWSVDSLKHSPSVDKSVCNTPRSAVLEALLDVRGAAPGLATVQAVDTAAQALAQALADQKSLNWYRLLVWGLQRAAQRGLDVFQPVYNMAVKARVDLVESWSRKGGAVFVYRLKQTQFYDEVMRSS